MKIGIVGAAGRMGKSLIEEIALINECELSGGLVRANSEFVGMDLGIVAGIGAIGVNATSNINTLVETSDAIIDFSNPTTCLDCAINAAEKKKIFVTGTTGFSQEQFEKLRSCAENTTIIWSANMSIGINMLMKFVEETAAKLDTSFDIEILEMHHCRKIDVPSGTALALGNAAAKGRGVELSSVEQRSRDGVTGARKEGEIGFAVLRGGDVVGEHSVIFAGDGERIEFTHKASSRKIFAKGALRAALWAKNKNSGLYSIQDVLQ